MKPIVLAWFVASAAALVLVGCGQKGPLYLPGHNPNPPKPLIKPANSDEPQPSSQRRNDQAADPSAHSDATDSHTGTP